MAVGPPSPPTPNPHSLPTPTWPAWNAIRDTFLTLQFLETSERQSKFLGGEDSRALRVAAPPCSPITIDELPCASVGNGQWHRAVAVAVMWCGAGARKTVVAYCLTRICCCSSTAFYCFGWVGGWVGGGRPRSLPTLQACEVSMGKFMSDSDYDRMPSTSGAGAVSLNSFRHGALSPRS